MSKPFILQCSDFLKSICEGGLIPGKNRENFTVFFGAGSLEKINPESFRGLGLQTESLFVGMGRIEIRIRSQKPPHQIGT